ncbi:MAG: hypothetical protein ABSC94_10060 [Polyangiaceae bacterium]
MNQTTQMHRIAAQLPSWSASFTPYYVDGPLELARRAGLLEFSPPGTKQRSRCIAYLERHGLAIDDSGLRGDYDLVVACSDLYVPHNVRGRRMILVQEGILDPLGLRFELCRRLPFLPRWIAGTAATGLSGFFDRFCVASDGYRDLFVGHGVDPERIVVTGIPNFDDCAQYLDNDFPYRGYVLVCTSDARETLKILDDRRSFLRWAKSIAGRRPMIFKMHPNENAERAKREILDVCPGALVFASGSAEHMIANCDALITQYSSTAFVGIALGREVHSYYDLAQLKRLCPLQNRCAAQRIAAVCQQVAAPARGLRTARGRARVWGSPLARLRTRRPAAP